MFQNYRVLLLDDDSKVLAETYYRADSLAAVLTWTADTVLRRSDISAFRELRGSTDD